MNIHDINIHELIKNNINKYGFHTYIIMGGSIPRYAYTIGLRDSLGTELVLAGAIYYSADEVQSIINNIYQQLKSDKNYNSVITLNDIGSFTLKKMCSTWINSLMLGAIDFYKTSTVKAYQILPDETHWTNDIPNLEESWNIESDPIWQWLYKEWPFNVSHKSTVVTNLDALRGAKITEIARWGDDEWEMFAGYGPDVSFNEARAVPLGTLLAADPTLKPALTLEIGKGLWRENVGDGIWHPWD